MRAAAALGTCTAWPGAQTKQMGLKGDVSAIDCCGLGVLEAGFTGDTHWVGTPLEEIKIILVGS